MLARTRQITVEAVQWRGGNEAELIAFFPKGTRFLWWNTDVGVYMGHGNDMTLFLSNWVVKLGDGYEQFSDHLMRQLFEPIEPPEENEGSD